MKNYMIEIFPFLCINKNSTAWILISVNIVTIEEVHLIFYIKFQGQKHGIEFFDQPDFVKYLPPTFKSRLRLDKK